MHRFRKRGQIAATDRSTRRLAWILRADPAPAPESGAPAALPIPGLLDVLHECDCGGLRREPCIRIALRRLATEQCEKCGQAFPERLRRQEDFQGFRGRSWRDRIDASSKALRCLSKSGMLESEWRMRSRAAAVETRFCAILDRRLNEFANVRNDMDNSDRVLTLAPALLLIGGAISLSCSLDSIQQSDASDAAFEQDAIAVVEAVQARSGSLPLSERLNGTVVAENQVELYPEISGRIVRVQAQDGQFVQNGQPLAVLGDTQYQEQLQQAEANFRVNQAALRQAQARLVELDVQFRRTRALAEEGLSSQLEVDTLEAQMDSAKASVDLAEAQIQQAQSAIEESKEILSKTVIRAPITGTIGRRNAEVGMQVNSNAQLFTIGDLSQVRVEVVLTEDLLNRVRIGQPARIYVGSGSSQQVLEARMSRISPFLDPVTRSTEAQIDVRNPGNTLNPGRFVTVDLLYGESRTSTLVPNSAVYTDPNSGAEGVFVVNSSQLGFQPEGSEDGETAVSLSPPQEILRRTVTILAEGRMEVAVEGVEPGEWVVAVGQDLISSDRNRARVRAASWERIIRLQGLQREDLLRQVLEGSGQ